MGRILKKGILLALLSIGLGSPLSAREPKTASRAELQIEIAVRFLRYTNWPNRPASGDEPLRVAVADFSSKREFHEHFAKRGADESGIEIVLLEADQDLEALPRFDVLFVEGGQDGAAAELIAAVSGLPVLVIGTSADWLDSGGMVRLKEVKGRVRFEVDLRTAAAVGISFDSALLNLAEVRR